MYDTGVFVLYRGAAELNRLLRHESKGLKEKKKKKAHASIETFKMEISDNNIC